LDDQPAPHFATACYLVAEPAERRLRVANAGHLPLLIRSPSGTVRPLRLPPAAPLGLLVGGFTETAVSFHPGDTLVMFTDGLVELPDRDIDDGVALLAAELERLGDQPSLDTLAEQLLEVMSRRPGYGNDDVALVLARLLPDR
jgi:serine phosphatase RsbU (regulator of sigma subunit)